MPQNAAPMNVSQGCFYTWGVLLVGVLVLRALLFGAPHVAENEQMRVPD